MVLCMYGNVLLYVYLYVCIVCMMYECVYEKYMVAV